MNTQLIDLKPIAKLDDREWLLMPKDVTFDIKDMRPTFYQFDAEKKEVLPDPKPMQVWLKFVPYELVT